MRSRSFELYAATVLLTQGLVFMIPGNTLDLPHWHDLRDWVAVFPGTEERFGVILSIVGVFRWIATIRDEKLRFSPVIRLVGIVIGIVFWMSLTISFLTARVGVTVAAVGWTIPAVCFEFFALTSATTDVWLFDCFGIRKRARARKMMVRNGNGK